MQLENQYGYSSLITLNSSLEFYSNRNFNVPIVPYGSFWNGSGNVTTQDAVYDKIETLPAFTDVSDLVSDSLASYYTITEVDDLINESKISTVTYSDDTLSIVEGSSTFKTEIGSSSSLWTDNGTTLSRRTTKIYCCLIQTRCFF